MRTVWRAFDRVEFTLLHTIVEGDLCTIVYQAEMERADGGSDSVASIEMFRVAGGRIVEVWNNSHQSGRWPEVSRK